MGTLSEKQKETLKKTFGEQIESFVGHPEYPYVLAEMLRIHSEKSNDYGSDSNPFANIELCEQAGYPAYKGVIVRMGDKYSRLLNVLCDKLLKNESAEDAFLDMATYAVIGFLEYRKNKNEKKTD